MTALNTPVNHGQGSQDFRRGLLIGAAATALLAASMAVAAFTAGLVGMITTDAAQLVQAPSWQADPGIAPRSQSVQAPTVQTYPDLGLRNAPAAPAAEPYPDLGLRNAPAAPAAEPYPDFGLRNAPAAPATEPYVDFGQRHAPQAPINESNPHRNGPIEAW